VQDNKMPTMGHHKQLVIGGWWEWWETRRNFEGSDSFIVFWVFFFRSTGG
jgi:hypothetical protein